MDARAIRVCVRPRRHATAAIRHSTPEPRLVDGRFKLRGSIDLIERHRKTGFLRVTDHKTGKNRTRAGQTVVDGGRVLQPVIYGLALEGAARRTKRCSSGRLFFCTIAGGFTQYEIPLLGDAPKRGLEVLEIIDRAIERGIAGGPAGRRRVRVVRLPGGLRPRRRAAHPTKGPELFADLDALRRDAMTLDAARQPTENRELDRRPSSTRRSSSKRPPAPARPPSSWRALSR